MKIFVFRNSTIEPLFSGHDVSFSGYSDILNIETEADLYIWFYTLPIKIDQQKVCEEIESYQGAISYILDKMQGGKMLLALTITEMSVIAYETINNPVKAAVSRFNMFLNEKAANSTNLKFIDFTSFTNSFGEEDLIDWKYFYMSMMVINPKLSGAFKNWFNAQLDAIDLRRKKCVILDLDNTIWGGVLGEDGMQGLKLGGSYPGNAFSDFQAGLSELSRKGVLLAICSKNNESEVMAAWDKLSGMVLKKQDISAFRINWNDKAQNIKEISNELNIGLDSFVFIDDNPTERDLIRGMLPMVEVPDFPGQPYGLQKFFKLLVDKYFRVYKLTAEDLQKNKLYAENFERVEFQKTYLNFEDYIKNLDITILVSMANSFNIARIAQMTQKTNQFNLTTKRYADTEIENFIKQGSWVYCIDVKDRFGDNGITGLMIIHFEKNMKLAVIDTFLLSCRIIGKKIEDQFLAYILDKLFFNKVTEVTARFIPTQKNDQVTNYYENQGFKILKHNPDGEKFYSLRKNGFRLHLNGNYKIIEK